MDKNNDHATTPIQEEILEKFYQKLTKSAEFNDLMVKQLRDHFESGKTPKADNLVKIFSAGSGETVT